MKQYKTVDAYIASFPKGVQKMLKELRMTIKKTAPQAEEKIAYGMPAYHWNGVLVYFGGFKDHVSFFPGASGVAAFKKDLTKYSWSKGTIQFPFDRPLPLPLVRKIVRFRLKENMAKAKVKSVKKK